MAYIISANGLLGGIVIAWLENIEKLLFFYTNRQITFGIMSLPNIPSGILGVVYASILVNEHRKL